MEQKETPLCQTGKFSCFGCCGHHYKKRDRVLADIKKNTQELKNKNLEENKKNLMHLRDSGICRGVVITDGKFMCGYHPCQHNGTDHRDHLCEKEYTCKSYHYYHTVWDETTKKRFLEFLEKQQVNWFEYSTKMDKGEFLDVFLKTNNL